MLHKDKGTPPNGKVPSDQVGLGLASTYYNYSAKQQARKPLDTTIFNKFDRKGIEAQLQAYLDLGLTPIPLKGKIPMVKWLHGNWNPKTLNDLQPYMPRNNWGLRTGGNFAVIDFDTKQDFYDFITANIEKLPDGLPLVQTSRGFHVWFRPTEPLRGMHFQGVDFKGEGGQVVAPPSIHPTTHQRYKFIRPPKEDIPELDLDELVFPHLKKRDTHQRGHHGKDRSLTSSFVDKPKFDLELIKDGVDEGQRHTSLVAYIGRLIWCGMSEDETRVLVTDWNEKNRPPLSKEELEGTVKYCYSRYAKEEAPDKNFVPTKTLSNFNSVIVGTKEYPRIDRRHPLCNPESPNPTLASDMAGSWETESDKVHTYLDCGKKRAIMRKGRAYMSVSFFCGRWNCPRCGPYFKHRWVEHMLEITKDTGLYVAEIGKDDWGRVRKQINRLKADYMKIDSVDTTFRIITDRPLDGSTELLPESVKTYLESSIPDTTPKCPISTSRAWQHHKKEKTSGDYEAVAITCLPVKEQVEVAEELGAMKVKYNRWVSPQDTDEAEWENQFKQAIWEREWEVSEWLKDKEHGMDMRDYLNQQYAEDAVNDEYEKESFIDRYLFEAA